MDPARHQAEEVRVIRPATNADLPRIVGIVFPVLESYGLKPDPAGTDADLADLDAAYFRYGGFFAVLEEPDGTVIGTYGLHRVDPSTCELRKMYLDPSRRGCGHGRAILEHAIAKARELGFRRMVLETASVLTEAIALYRNHGFVPYRPPHLSARCDLAFERNL
jgi:putative acetyltransferase